MKKQHSKNNNNVSIDKPGVIQAITACIKHASDYHDTSEQQIATSISVPADTLNRWVKNGTMPLHKITAFENACHVIYVTKYLAEASGFMVTAYPPATAEPKNIVKAVNKSSEIASQTVKGYWQSKTTKIQALKAIDGAIDMLLMQKTHIQNHAS